MIQDFIHILSQCIDAIDSGTFFGVAVGALVLGALCWFGCSRYTRLWHKRFHVRLQHHLLCALAAVLTMLFAVLFYAIGNLQYIVNNIINEWSEALVDDNEWNAQTYETAFYTVMELNPNEFVRVPKPGSKDSYIPVNTTAMQQTCAEVYVYEACAAFSTQHPFLDKMLSARPGISKEEILEDIQDFFNKHQGEFYPARRAVEIATEHIREGLLEQSPKTVWKTRLILVFLFLTVQLIPFGVIGYFAYRDLKIEKYNYFNQKITYDF